MDTKDKLFVLYNTTKEDYDLGTYSEFKSKMQDEGSRRAYYNTVGVDYDLGTWDEFEAKLSPWLEPEKVKPQAQPTAASVQQKPVDPVWNARMGWQLDASKGRTEQFKACGKAAVTEAKQMNVKNTMKSVGIGQGSNGNLQTVYYSKDGSAQSTPFGAAWENRRIDYTVQYNAASNGDYSAIERVIEKEFEKLVEQFKKERDAERSVTDKDFRAEKGAEVRYDPRYGEIRRSGNIASSTDFDEYYSRMQHVSDRYNQKMSLNNLVPLVMQRLPDGMVAGYMDGFKKSYLKKHPKATQKEIQEKGFEALATFVANGIQGKATADVKKEFDKAPFVVSALMATSPVMMYMGGYGDNIYKNAALMVNEDWNDNNKVLGFSSAVVGMVIDPLFRGCGKAAGFMAKKAFGWGAARWLLSQTGRRVGAGVATRAVMMGTKWGKPLYGGLASGLFFALYDEGMEAASQVMTGEGDAGKLLWKPFVGFGKGAAIGAASGMFGNVVDKGVLNSATKTEALAKRAAGLGIDFATETAVFGSVDAIMSGNVWDSYKDAAEMVLGFKLLHVGKGAAKTGAGAAVETRFSDKGGSRRGELTPEKGFWENVADRLVGAPDMKFTKSELAELKKYGYDDVGKLLAEKDPITFKELDGGEAEATEHYYDNAAKMLSDNRVSETARAKMAYVLTGKYAPLSSVMHCERSEYKTKKGKTVYCVDAIGSNGLISRQEFTSKGAADKAANAVWDQAHLNFVVFGEDFVDKAARANTYMSAARMMHDRYSGKIYSEGDGSRRMCYSDDELASLYMDLKGRSPEELNDEQAAFVRDFDAACMAAGRVAVDSASIRKTVGKRYGVDIDAAIKKGIGNRTQHEQAAVTEYIERLYQQDKNTPQLDGKEGAPYRRDRYEGAYDRGRYAQEEDRADIVDRKRVADEAFADAFGVSVEDVLSKYLASHYISKLIGEGASREEIEIAAEAFEAHSAYSGMKDGMWEAEKAASDAELEQTGVYVHKDGKSIRPAKLKTGEDVYIHDGDVAVHDDGTIDVANSSETIVVTEAATGKPRVVSAEAFESLGEATDVDTIAAESRRAAEERYNGSLAEAEGRLDIREGAEVPLRLYDGSVGTGVVKEVREDGTCIIEWDGREWGIGVDTLQDEAAEIRKEDYARRHPAEERYDDEADIEVDDEADIEPEDEAADFGGSGSGSGGDIDFSRPAEVTVTDENGRERKGYITGDRDDDGRVMYYISGEDDFRYADEDDLRGMITEYKPVVDNQGGEAAPNAEAVDSDGNALAVGDAVTHERYGAGEVVEIDDEGVRVRFGDDEVIFSHEFDIEGGGLRKASEDSLTENRETPEGDGANRPAGDEAIRANTGEDEINRSKTAEADIPGGETPGTVMNGTEVAARDSEVAAREIAADEAAREAARDSEAEGLRDSEADEVAADEVAADAEGLGLEIPLDKNGEPKFLDVTPERGREYVYNDPDFDKETADAFVGNKIAEAEKALEKLQNKPPKVGASMAAYKAQKAAWEEKVSDAQKAVDYWHAVRDAQDKVDAEALKDAQAEARAAAKAEREAVGVDKVGTNITGGYDGAQKIYGHEDEIILPNGERVKGRWVLSTPEATTASHDPFNGYRQSEGFPKNANGSTINDRDYERDKAAQQANRDKAANYDGRAIQNPIINTKDGIVVSGNDRDMAGKVAAADNTDARYLADLRGAAHKYGFTPEQVESIPHARLRFELAEPMDYTTENFAKFNAQEMKSQSNTETAVKMGKVVDDAVFTQIVQSIGEFETLGDFYNDARAGHVAIGALVTGGVVGKERLPELIEEGSGKLSEQGRKLLESVLVGKFFEQDPDAVRILSEHPAMRQRVVYALSELADNYRLGDYSLKEEMGNAVRLCADATSGGKYKLGDKVGEFGLQGSLFPDADNTEVFKQYTVMMLADLLNHRNVTELKKVVSLYDKDARQAASGQMDLFSGEVVSKEDILKEILDKYGNRKIEREPTSARGEEGGNESHDASSPGDEGSFGGEPRGETRGTVADGEAESSALEGNRSITGEDEINRSKTAETAETAEPTEATETADAGLGSATESPKTGTDSSTADLRGGEAPRAGAEGAAAAAGSGADSEKSGLSLLRDALFPKVTEKEIEEANDLVKRDENGDPVETTRSKENWHIGYSDIEHSLHLGQVYGTRSMFYDGEWIGIVESAAGEKDVYRLRIDSFGGDDDIEIGGKKSNPGNDFCYEFTFDSEKELVEFYEQNLDEIRGLELEAEEAREDCEREIAGVFRSWGAAPSLEGLTDAEVREFAKEAKALNERDKAFEDAYWAYLHKGEDERVSEGNPLDSQGHKDLTRDKIDFEDRVRSRVDGAAIANMMMDGADAEEAVKDVKPKRKKVGVQDFVWKDKTAPRPNMSGVYHHDGRVSATDTHILIDVEENYPAEREGKIVDSKGNVVDTQMPFPNIEKIFSGGRVEPLGLDIKKTREVTVALASAVKPKKGSHTAFVVINNKLYDAHDLAKVLQAAGDYGLEDVKAGNNGILVISGDKGRIAIMAAAPLGSISNGDEVVYDTKSGKIVNFGEKGSEAKNVAKEPESGYRQLNLPGEVEAVPEKVEQKSLFDFDDTEKVEQKSLFDFDDTEKVEQKSLFDFDDTEKVVTSEELAELPKLTDEQKRDSRVQIDWEHRNAMLELEDSEHRDSDLHGALVSLDDMWQRMTAMYGEKPKDKDAAETVERLEGDIKKLRIEMWERAKEELAESGSDMDVYVTGSGDVVGYKSGAGGSYSADGDVMTRRQGGDLDAAKGEFCSVERVMREERRLDLSGAKVVKSAADVAYMSRCLESKSVEHVFAVMVKNGEAIVIHGGVGAVDATVCDVSAIKVAADRYQPDKIYLVHNHPSGKLDKSGPDAILLNRVKEQTGMRDVEGIIMDTFDETFAVFGGDNDGIYNRDKSVADEVEVKQYVFDGVAFNKDYAPNMRRITTPQSAAEYIASLRLGSRGKVGYLVLNNANNITANICTDHTEIEDDNIAALVDDAMHKVPVFGGVGVIFYSTSPIENINDAFYTAKNETRKRGGGIRVLDMVYATGRAGEYIAGEGGRITVDNVPMAMERGAKNDGVLFRTSGDLEKSEKISNFASKEIAEGLGDIFYDDNSAEYRVAVVDYLKGSDEGRDLLDALWRHRGTPWAKVTASAVAVRMSLEDLTAGRKRRVDSALDTKHPKLAEKIRRRGMNAVWSHLMQQGVIGHAGKPVNNVNGSHMSCRPSDDCAKFCYASRRNYSYSTSTIKGELVYMAVKEDPKRVAGMIADNYRSTEAFYNGKALRLFDKGDLDNAWVPVINELNRLGIRTQIFTKRPDVLDAIDKEANVVMMSIDASNLQMLDGYPDLPIAFVYSGKKDLPVLEKCRERFEEHGGSILPVIKNGNVLDESDIKELPRWTLAYQCPIDNGSKKVVNKENPLMSWDCTKCDNAWGAGCFYHRTKKYIDKKNGNGEYENRGYSQGDDKRVATGDAEGGMGSAGALLDTGRSVGGSELRRGILRSLREGGLSDAHITPALLDSLVRGFDRELEKRDGVGNHRAVQGNNSEEAGVSGQSDRAGLRPERTGGIEAEGATADAESREAKVATEKAGVAAAVGKELRTEVRVVGSEDELTALDSYRAASEATRAKMRGAKGWYVPSTGEVVVVAHNNRDAEDAAATVLHEVVGHKGIAEMLGGAEQARAFYDEVYGHLYGDARKRVNERMAANGWDAGKATEEYMAELAEKGFEDFDAADRSIWKQFKAKVLEWIDKLLTKAGVKLPKWVKLGDNELRYILWKSRNNLRGGGAMAAAEDVAKRRELGIDDVNFRDDGATESLNDRSMSPSERLTDIVTKMSQAHADDMEMRDNAMRKVSENLKDLVYEMRNRTIRTRRFKGADAKVDRGVAGAMREQAKFDKTTVKRVADLAKVLLRNGYLNGANKTEMQKLLSATEGAVGKADITGSVEDILDVMIDNHLRNGESMLSKILSIKGTRVNAKGIEVQGKLDAEGRRAFDIIKKAMRMDRDAIEEMLDDAEGRMSDESAIVADNAAIEHRALKFALDYVEKIRESEVSEEMYRSQLRDEKAKKDAGVIGKDAYNEFKTAVKDAIRARRIERADAYMELAGQLGGMAEESAEAAKKYREAEKQRVSDIHHDANKDMQGRPCNEHHRQPTWISKQANGWVLQFLGSPLGTFEQMLRMFGNKNAAGEGYLWNRYVRGWMDCREKAILGKDAKFKTLDDKAREIFGKRKKFEDVIRLAGKLPKMNVAFMDGGEMRGHELNQGQLMYVYMVDKMADGRMKLREMGITDETMADIEDFMDPRLREMADWLQDEFLPSAREEYNEVYKRLYGTSMPAIEHYFPLRILGNDLTESEVGKNEQRPSGVIQKNRSTIKRRPNKHSLDLMGEDAFKVILDHVVEMEQWAAFAEWQRDLNTLLTYKRFRNQVKNMTSVYGSGELLWSKFKDACRLAAGTYEPKSSRLDKPLVNIAKGVTMAKVNFRPFTALKQLLSAPAYLAEARIVYLLRDFANPIGAWMWCWENLPVFRERWESRMSGDPRLMKTDMDWRMWRNRYVQMASRVGMSPNAFVDATTVAIGAHAIYSTKVKSYLRDGYSKEAAEERARQDASILPNQTQQSSEGIFLAPMQADRTWLNVALTVFRNASMSYTRQVYDALRNLKRNLNPANVKETVDFMARQLEDDGVKPKDARKAAKWNFARQIKRDALRLALFGYILEAAWNLGGYGLYMLFGSDDEERKGMVKDSLRHAMFGSIEGLSMGDVWSAFGNMAVSGEFNQRGLEKDMPIVADIRSMIGKFTSDKEAEAMNDIVNILVQCGAGVNPQVIENVAIGIYEKCNNDPEMAKEATLMYARILQTPPSQIDKVYFDEIRMDGNEASKLTPAQIAERYAHCKVISGATALPWTWNDEDMLSGYEKTAKKRMREILDTRGDATMNDKWLKYDEIYKGVSKKRSAVKNTMKEDYVTGAEKAAELHSDKDSLRVYGIMEGGNHFLEKYAEFYFKSKSPEEAKMYADAIVKVKEITVKMVECRDEAEYQRLLEERTRYTQGVAAKRREMHPKR